MERDRISAWIRDALSRLPCREITLETVDEAGVAIFRWRQERLTCGATVAHGVLFTLGSDSACETIWRALREQRMGQ